MIFPVQTFLHIHDLQRERDAMTEEMAREYYAREERDAVDRTEDRSLLLQDRARLGSEELIRFFSCEANKQTLHWKTKSRTF